MVLGVMKNIEMVDELYRINMVLYIYLLVLVNLEKVVLQKNSLKIVFYGDRKADYISIMVNRIKVDLDEEVFSRADSGSFDKVLKIDI